MLLIILLTKVQLNRSSLKNPLRFAGCLVNYSRNTAIGVDFKKPWLLLRVLGNIDFMGVVLYPEFLEGDADFVAIGRATCISSGGIVTTSA